MHTNVLLKIAKASVSEFLCSFHDRKVVASDLQYPTLPRVVNNRTRVFPWGFSIESAQRILPCKYLHLTPTFQLPCLALPLDSQPHFRRTGSRIKSHVEFHPKGGIFLLSFSFAPVQIMLAISQSNRRKSILHQKLPQMQIHAKGSENTLCSRRVGVDS